jgi:hypothetical protein
MRNTATIYRLTCLAIVFPLLLAACKKGEHISPGNQEEIHVETVDTVTVKASTFLLDSVPTSNQKLILIGQTDDKDFGKLKASSYLQLTPPALTDALIPKGAAFDTFTIVLKYNKYFSGDTLAPQKYAVHRMTEDMILRKIPGPVENEEVPVYVKGQALYSTTTFKHDAAPIGNLDLQVKPASGDSVIITLNEALGREFLDLMTKKDPRFASEEEFLKYFKGMVFKTTQGNSITGFKADQVKMYLGYNYFDAAGFSKKGRVTFSGKFTDYQFNHFDTDRSQTKLSALSRTNREISSERTGQQLFLQGGTGLVTKLKFPTLVNFLNESKKVVNKVELLIETKPTYYSIFKAPPSLLLWVANSANVPKMVLPNNYKEEDQIAAFEPGNDVGSTGKYKFLLTQYTDQLKKGTYKTNSLMLSVPADQLLGSLNRAQLSTSETALSIKLIITYTKY